MTEACGTAERAAALIMLGRQGGRQRATLGADKAYDAAGFVADLRALDVTPHVAQNTASRRSAIDRRTTRHPGYATSQRLRKRIEEGFGWIKTVGGLRKTRHRGRARVGWLFTRPRPPATWSACPSCWRQAIMPESPARPKARPDGGRTTLTAAQAIHLQG